MGPGVSMSKDANIPTNHSFVQLDLPLLDRLSVIQRICLTIVFLIAGGTLAAWALPQFGTLLPAAWMHMKATSCVATLCTALSLILAQPKRGSRMLLVS